jgi:hypothetical protein
VRKEKNSKEIRKRLEKAVALAKPEIATAVAVLEKLLEIEPSMERASMLGSAHKRLALIASAEGDAATEADQIAAMKRYYEQAESIGRDSQLEGFFYPALNRLSAEFALGNGRVELDPQRMAAIRADLDSTLRDNPDFWSVVSQTELEMYESLSRGDLANQVPRIIAAYDDLNLRVQTQWMWSSVYDQAQFVLPKYAKDASADEKQAAQRVIDRLGELSGRRLSGSARTIDTDRAAPIARSRPSKRSPRKTGSRATRRDRPGSRR